MKTEEALKLLRGGVKGIEEWTRWRKTGDILSIRDADLAGADLRAVDFTLVGLLGVDFTEANLEQAQCFGAIFVDAILTRANLDLAVLNAAELSGASLDGASLFRTELRGAHLDSTHLNGTHFKETHLAGADMRHATVGGTIFSNVDLGSICDLVVQHSGPSTLGLDTILRSGGRIPDDFIRGCGYDPRLQRIILGEYDALMEAAYSQARPLRLQSCFISYSTQDRTFVDHLQKKLNEEGLDYWYAPEHGEWGRKLTTQLDREITLRDRVLLVCSRNSLTDSNWVQREIEKAFVEEERRGKEVIFPITIDDEIFTWDHPRATRIRETLVGDFRNATKGKAFEEKVERLMKGLRVE